MRRHRPPPPASIQVPPRWPKRVLTAVAAALLIVLAVCERSQRPPPTEDDRTRYHDRTFRVARVVDGDTLDIDAPDKDRAFTRIRLWGVDTPELGHFGEPEAHFGPEAKAFAERMLSGREVHIVLSPTRSRGKYGRLLAYVFLERGGRMFNELLLEQGYAYADLRFGHHYKKKFEAIERRARRGGAGLWAEVTPQNMPEWKQRFEQARRGGD